MGIKKYYATADNTITNARGLNISTRGTGSNMGASDILEVFSIYGQVTTSSAELSRVLVDFPISTITTDRSAGNIPSSGSVDFYLKLCNAEHGNTVPQNSELTIVPISRSWNEGTGLDMEDYKDLQASNWISASSGTSWTSVGGDFHASPSYTKTLDTGTEDVEIDITSMVEEWVAGTKDSYGLAVKLSPSYETYLSNSSGEDSGSVPHNISGATRSYYTKRFYGRGTQYFYKKPTIEARWDSTTKDNRYSFNASSSLAPASDNLNKLYIYNRVRGRLVDIPSVGTGEIFLSLYKTGSTGPSGSAVTLYHGGTNITGGHFSTGIYSASVAVDTTEEYLYDVWHNDAGTQFTTGSKFSVFSVDSDVQVGIGDHVTNITNLKPSYSDKEQARFRVFVRDRDWNPTIYTVATTNISSKIVENAYWKLYRVQDNEVIYDYGTGSMHHTRMSYDRDGNYFDVDMSSLEKGYSYAMKFVYKINDRYDEQSETFKFRVD